jgi:acetolactate decarboxylase
MPGQSQRTKLRIGELAAATGIGRDSLRIYERRGLIPAPPRTEGRFREYPISAIQRVRVIQAALTAGFTLAELATVLLERSAGRPPCKTVRRLAGDKLAILDREIVALTAIRDRLRSTIEKWDQRLAGHTAGEAGLLDSLANDGASSLTPSPRRHTLRSRRHNLMLGGALLLALTAPACRKSIAPIQAEPRAETTVQVWGQLRAIMHEGRSEPVVTLKEANGGGHVFAVGALSGLRGEITVDDGQIWLAYAAAGKVNTTVGAASDEAAALLVATSVPLWQLVTLPAAIAAATLDAEVEMAAQRAGLATNRSIPVVVEGTLTDLVWHVMNGPPLNRGAGHDDHLRTALTGREARVQGKLIGFFSPNAQGVFTHMGQKTHFHVVLPNRPLTAHVDSVGLAAGATIRFPALTGG